MRSIHGWRRDFPRSPSCRYADDGLVHCRTKAEAEAIKAALQARFEECELEMHPDKTKIVYCKDSNRRGFLHYAFDTWLAAGLPAVAIVSIRRRRARSLPNQG
ncbi:reverse transcriptase domain-containing protein [Bradyrhizobium sp. USDA 4523]